MSLLQETSHSFVELLSINGEPTTPIPAAPQSFIRPTTTRLHAPQKCLGSAQLPEDWCWPICSQHEINGPVRLCVNVARCRLHITSCMVAPNSNLRATSMRWITLLFWNTLPNQSSDQHVFLFVHTKEEGCVH